MSQELPPSPQETIPFIEATLHGFGCPPDKSKVMASQLDKRARQLAELKNKPYHSALQHLLQVVKMGSSGETPPQ